MAACWRRPGVKTEPSSVSVALWSVLWHELRRRPMSPSPAPQPDHNSAGRQQGAHVLQEPANTEKTMNTGKKKKLKFASHCKLESKLAPLSDFWTSTNAERIIEQGLWIFHCDALWPLMLRRPEMKATCVEWRMQLNKHRAPTTKRIYQPNASVAAAAALFKRLMAAADWYSWDL